MFEPCGAVTGIGGLPFADPATALDLVFAACPEMPFWPQLPRRDRRENMYIQYLEGFPGLEWGGPDGRAPVLRRSDDADQDRALDALVAIHEDYLAGRTRPIAPEWAAGLAAFLDDPRARRAPGVKGQVTGPISVGQALATDDGRLLLYDENLMEATVRRLNMAARWQQEKLAELGAGGAGCGTGGTLIFVDEPSLSTLGSAFFNYDRSMALALLSGVKEGLAGLSGVHCCGNTDWSVLLDSGFDVLSFDAYYHAGRLALYADRVAAFIQRGGVLAWGIVPTTPSDAAGETVRSLLGKLEAGIKALAGRGVDEERLVRQCLITPSCGMGGLEEGEAARILELAAEVSHAYRRARGLRPARPGHMRGGGVP